MNISNKYFITGTDTEIGKTYTSVGILKAFNKLKYSTLGLKPIASGIQESSLYPSDTILLHHAASIKLPLKNITPFAFRPAIAPHLAARELNYELSVQTLNHACQKILDLPADICVIEGFGGWCAPLNYVETMADFVKRHQFNVIIVVGMRLGCLNHAILTQKVIQQSGVKIAGWIANCITPNMDYLFENISTLQKCLPIPHLGTIGHHLKAEDHIDISRLINNSLVMTT